MAHLVSYGSSTELLDAITPHLLPHREWQSHLVLGLNLENITNPTNPHDFYIATWVGEELQIVVFHFHKLPINVTPCREEYDMRHLEQQLDLLAEYITTRSKETMDEYRSITAPESLSLQLATRIGNNLCRSISPTMRTALSYIDKVKFKPYQLQDPTHTIRQARLDDNIENIAQVVHEFQRAAPNAPPSSSMSIEELINVITGPIGRGLYYIYILPDGTIPSVVMLRRPTATGIAIVMVATAKAHRGKGYASVLTSWAIQNALEAEENGGRGKDRVCIIWDSDGDAARIYKRLGFVEGQARVDFKLGPASAAPKNGDDTNRES